MLTKLSMTVKKENTTQYCDKLANKRKIEISGATNSQPLSVILLISSKESAQRVVAGNDEASEVGEELTAEVEDDEEEVESAKTNDGIGLGHTSCPLEVVQDGVFGQLSRWHRRQQSRTFRHWTETGRASAEQPAICLSTYLLVELSQVVLSFVSGGGHFADWCKVCREMMCGATNKLRVKIESWTAKKVKACGGVGDVGCRITA